jgi:hypothetical protein
VADLFENFEAVVGALTDASIPFAVCGGLAMVIHARPRATIDIDLLAPAQAIPKLVDAVAPLGFLRRERRPTRLAGGEIVLHRLTRTVPGDPDVLMLDVIEVGSGITGQAWNDRMTIEWKGHAVPLVSRRSLIALKRLRSSPQDVADIAALEEPA